MVPEQGTTKEKEMSPDLNLLCCIQINFKQMIDLKVICKTIKYLKKKMKKIFGIESKAKSSYSWNQNHGPQKENNKLGFIKINNFFFPEKIP